MNPIQTAETAEQATLRQQLCQVLAGGQHDGRSVIFACARNRRDSVQIVTPGYALTATTLRGAPAYYLDWTGPETERVDQLTKYTATLTAAGWTAIPVAHWPHGRRVHYQLTWSPAMGATVGLLVAAPAAGGVGEATGT